MLKYKNLSSATLCLLLACGPNAGGQGAEGTRSSTRSITALSLKKIVKQNGNKVSVDLLWKAENNASYVVKRGESSDDINEVVGTVSAATINDNNVAIGKRYFYTVSSGNNILGPIEVVTLPKPEVVLQETDQGSANGVYHNSVKLLVKNPLPGVSYSVDYEELTSNQLSSGIIFTVGNDPKLSKTCRVLATSKNGKLKSEAAVKKFEIINKQAQDLFSKKDEIINLLKQDSSQLSDAAIIKIQESLNSIPEALKMQFKQMESRIEAIEGMIEANRSTIGEQAIESFNRLQAVKAAASAAADDLSTVVTDAAADLLDAEAPKKKSILGKIKDFLLRKNRKAAELMETAQDSIESIDSIVSNGDDIIDEMLEAVELTADDKLLKKIVGKIEREMDKFAMLCARKHVKELAKTKKIASFLKMISKIKLKADARDDLVAIKDAATKSYTEYRETKNKSLVELKDMLAAFNVIVETAGLSAQLSEYGKVDITDLSSLKRSINELTKACSIKMGNVRKRFRKAKYIRKTMRLYFRQVAGSIAFAVDNSIALDKQIEKINDLVSHYSESPKESEDVYVSPVDIFNTICKRMGLANYYQIGTSAKLLATEAITDENELKEEIRTVIEEFELDFDALMDQIGTAQKHSDDRHTFKGYATGYLRAVATNIAGLIKSYSEHSSNSDLKKIKSACNRVRGKQSYSTHISTKSLTKMYVKIVKPTCDYLEIDMHDLTSAQDVSDDTLE